MSFRGVYPINLNYPPSLVNEPRYGYGKPPHPLLYEILNRGRSNYERLLSEFLNYKNKYQAINIYPDEMNQEEPHLSTPWLPGLDSLTLYCLIVLHNPAKYLEIGLGNSTKFARRAIRDYKLQTKIIGIDPEPRTEVGSICDQITKQPVETIDISFFDQLEANDILFVDNSHRAFMNSDATIIFLDILPRLKSGVLVEIHDIFLPYDYPPKWVERYYNEQYLLAAYLLAEGQKFEVLLPNSFISYDQPLRGIVDPIFADLGSDQVKRGGGSFWLRVR